jgi:hypothetical protein
MLKDMGCKYVVYADTSHGTQGEIDTPISKGPRLADDEWKAYGRKLTKVAEKMAESSRKRPKIIVTTMLARPASVSTRDAPVTA